MSFQLEHGLSLPILKAFVCFLSILLLLEIVPN